MTNGEKLKKGFQTTYKNNDFINALTETPQTTSSIAKKVGCSLEWARQKLMKLSNEQDSIVEKMEVEGSSRTGKMYLWKLKEIQK